jgi:hypothetical protein
MNQTFFYDVNGNYVTNNIVENFGINVGNSTKVNNSKNFKILSETEKEIDRSSVVKGLTKLISDAVTEVSSSNTSELAKTIALSNKINISKIKAESVSITNITQEIKLDSKVSAEFIQKIQGKVYNEITKKIADKVSNLVDSSTKSEDTNTENSQDGTSIGNIVDKAGDVLKDVLNISVGNSTNIDNSVNVDETFIDKLKLDESFKIEKNLENSNKIKNALDNKNLSKCSQSTNQTNELKFSDAELSGKLEVKNIKQFAAVNAIMNCAFNNEIVNEVATKIFEDYEKNISNMIKSADEYAKKNNSTSTSGDIYAMGVAGSKVLEGAGKGIKDAGSGVSAAAEGVGKGVSATAEGVGKGISSALTGLMGPLLIGGLLLIVVAIGYFIFKNMINDEDDE